VIAVRRALRGQTALALPPRRFMPKHDRVQPPNNSMQRLAVRAAADA
jgi:hypothetical protein